MKLISKNLYDLHYEKKRIALYELTTVANNMVIDERARFTH